MHLVHISCAEVCVDLSENKRRKLNMSELINMKDESRHGGGVRPDDWPTIYCLFVTYVPFLPPSRAN